MNFHAIFPIISQSSNLVSLLILMPRFQILHIPGPETARLIKKCKQSFGFFQNQNLKKKWQDQFNKSFSKNFFCNAIKVMKKFCQITRGQYLIFFKKNRNFFCIFGETGHFWTFKLQNLESIHQHLSTNSPSMMYGKVFEILLNVTVFSSLFFTKAS